MFRESSVTQGKFVIHPGSAFQNQVPWMIVSVAEVETVSIRKPPFRLALLNVNLLT